MPRRCAAPLHVRAPRRVPLARHSRGQVIRLLLQELMGISHSSLRDPAGCPEKFQGAFPTEARASNASERRPRRGRTHVRQAKNLPLRRITVSGKSAQTSVHRSYGPSALYKKSPCSLNPARATGASATRRSGSSALSPPFPRPYAGPSRLSGLVPGQPHRESPLDPLEEV